METLVPIDEFARLTHLSVRALRHYHDVGLLEPTQIDPYSGYRRYRVEQSNTAQLIRRLRILDMPVPEIAALVGAADTAVRDQLLAGHLDRVERTIDRLSAVVSSLQSLLTTEPTPLVVNYRLADPTPAYAFSAVVDRGNIAAWCGRTFPLLYQVIEEVGDDPAGPGGALYSDDFFTADAGEVTAHVPVSARAPIPHLVQPVVLPAARLAVTVHHGPFSELDRTYALLGTHVAQHDLIAPAPIQEIYLLGPDHVRRPADYSTEVCWPVQAPTTRTRIASH